MKGVVLVFVILLFVVAKSPATLVDHVVSDVSQGAVRISGTEGTVWQGRGLLSVIDLATREQRPWREVRWSFDPIGLFRGEISWLIIINGADASRAAVGIAGWRIVNLGISGPAENFLQRMSGPLGKLGWDGDIDLIVSSMDCSWRQICNGQIAMLWNGAGSSFLPGQVFGDYQLKVNGVAGEFELSWNSTKESNVRTSGTGKVVKSGALSLSGTVTGDPELLSRLPAVAGPWAKPTAVRDTWRIVFP